MHADSFSTGHNARLYFSAALLLTVTPSLFRHAVRLGEHERVDAVGRAHGRMGSRCSGVAPLHRRALRQVRTRQIIESVTSHDARQSQRSTRLRSSLECEIIFLFSHSSLLFRTASVALSVGPAHVCPLGLGHSGVALHPPHAALLAQMGCDDSRIQARAGPVELRQDAAAASLLSRLTCPLLAHLFLSPQAMPPTPPPRRTKSWPVCSASTISSAAGCSPSC